MEESSRSSLRLIRFTDEARLDVARIDNATFQRWGEAQAERYIAYLSEIFAYLAREPSLGEPLRDWPGYRVYTAKYRKRRNAYGHRIFYREIEDGIRIIRILHTAMNWPDHLGDL